LISSFILSKREDLRTRVLWVDFGTLATVPLPTNAEALLEEIWGVGY